MGHAPGREQGRGTRGAVGATPAEAPTGFYQALSVTPGLPVSRRHAVQPPVRGAESPHPAGAGAVYGALPRTSAVAAASPGRGCPPRVAARPCRYGLSGGVAHHPRARGARPSPHLPVRLMWAAFSPLPWWWLPPHPALVPRDVEANDPPTTRAATARPRCHPPCATCVPTGRNRLLALQTAARGVEVEAVPGPPVRERVQKGGQVSGGVVASPPVAPRLPRPTDSRTSVVASCVQG